MRFYKRLYLSEGLKGKRRITVRQIRQAKYPLSLYMLTLPQTVQNQLEILPAALLYQKILPAESLQIVGLAESQAEAFALVEQITQEVYDNRKDTKIREYLLEIDPDLGKQKKGKWLW